MITTSDIYDLAALLPRFVYGYEQKRLPINGIYLFFERGETIVLDGKIVDRIVRVGTHREDGNFQSRIRQHYGQVHSLRGNKNGSIFRRHVGGALLRRQGANDDALSVWAAKGTKDGETETEVSQCLRENFTSSCFTVDNRTDRLEIERGIIAMLAQTPLGAPSPTWLGHEATHADIREFGIWNTQGTRAAALTADEFQKFEQLVRASASAKS